MICKPCNNKPMEFIGRCLWVCMECNKEKYDPEQEFGGGRDR
jgi:ribosomal protein L37AE/L43A